MLDNRASGFVGGGAIYTSGLLLLAGQVTIVNNTAKSGGAVYGNGSAVRMEGLVQFTNNSAVDSGGALFVSQATSVNILGGMLGSSVGVQFTTNYAGSYGGAVFIVGERSRLSASNMVKFEGNTAVLTGGAMVAGGSTSVVLRADSANERSDSCFVCVYVYVCVWECDGGGRLHVCGATRGFCE
jgi:predicted outer membrane repeat protein